MTTTTKTTIITGTTNILIFCGVELHGMVWAGLEFGMAFLPLLFVIWRILFGTRKKAAQAYEAFIIKPAHALVSSHMSAWT